MIKLQSLFTVCRVITRLSYDRGSNAKNNKVSVLFSNIALNCNNCEVNQLKLFKCSSITVFFCHIRPYISLYTYNLFDKFFAPYNCSKLFQISSVVSSYVKFTLCMTSLERFRWIALLAFSYIFQTTHLSYLDLFNLPCSAL